MVVSPLVALMDDQMAELARVGIPGIRVTAESTKEESRDLRQRLLDPETSHLVRTPARFFSVVTGRAH